jgi:luciferase-type oxidoreductase
MYDALIDTPPTATPGYRRMFAPGRLTVGVFFPIEAYAGDRPTMTHQVELAQQAEAANIAALWVRDVPLRDPAFGDVGQIYDPWVYLGYMVAHTRAIALATGAIVLPLRHVLHVAKAAASVDRLSRGRLVLGVATGDRPVEFPAFGRSFERRGDALREAIAVLTRVWRENAPRVASPLATLDGEDVVPKPTASGVPLLVTGRSQQTLEWIAQHSDGWVTYPRPEPAQADVVAMWRQAAARTAPGVFKPFSQSLYIDLVAGRVAPTPIHLGYRLGVVALRDLLHRLEDAGVNHVILNLKYGSRPAAVVLEELERHLLGAFPPGPHPTTPLSESINRSHVEEEPCLYS